MFMLWQQLPKRFDKTLKKKLFEKLEKMIEISLPEKVDFYSHLSMKDITHANKLMYLRTFKICV